MSNKELLLGIDIGLANTGFALVSEDFKLIKTHYLKVRSKDLRDRLSEILRCTNELINYSPTRIVYEHVCMVGTTGANLNKVIGLLFSAAIQSNLPIHGISPIEVKKIVANNSKASKQELEASVIKLLNMPNTSFSTDHESDAAAIACSYLLNRQ